MEVIACLSKLASSLGFSGEPYGLLITFMGVSWLVPQA